MAHDEIVVLGAGIIGLSVALELSKRGYGQYVTVVAEHLPGDKTTHYTSPWAGGNFSGISGSDKNALHWDRLGYLTMMDLVDRGAEEAKYLLKTASTEYWDEMPSRDKIQSIVEYLRDPVQIPKNELPPGVSFGIRFTTLTINAPAHCQHLQDILSKPQSGGVRFTRRKIASLADAFLSPATKIVFNCIGNAAASFPGVMDSKCYPTRGQIVLVKAPSVTQNIMRHGKDYETYVIPRPLSDSTVVLGGYLQKGNWDSQVKSHETESILKRTGELLPVLNNGETQILGEAVGFRPSREGGARVELEQMEDGGKIVVHNYGAGGTGFQAGLGMAKDAVDLADEKLRDIKEKSRL
ncbi:FAD-dependent oxidoreductase [Aspergillus melleus]|uniref:FAD-dependent oxidoreductase n=1 Tax=Aspergillus melleus TaxID=138277 RepID=UPI001E8E0121|nr:D-aspartate oxidase [Aspergillus melleus]KAH8430811.1 D-aspartate oxidase [Aspergillus melleus]